MNQIFDYKLNNFGFGLTEIMKVDFLQITRLPPLYFAISLENTPRYAKPEKNKTIKIKLCLHNNIESNIHF